MQEWVAAAKAEAGPCPSCDGDTARPIVYGLPDFASYERLQDEVVFAGCCVPERPPAYSCSACGASWGERSFGAEEPPVDPFADLDP